MSFELPNLPFSYDALEPHIDARTMEIHHSKHHAAYTTNLNNAIAGSDLENLSIEELQTIPGSGADGRLQKSDVFNYLKNNYLDSIYRDGD